MSLARGSPWPGRSRRGVACALARPAQCVRSPFSPAAVGPSYGLAPAVCPCRGDAPCSTPGVAVRMRAASRRDAANCRDRLADEDQEAIQMPSAISTNDTRIASVSVVSQSGKRFAAFSSMAGALPNGMLQRQNTSRYELDQMSVEATIRRARPADGDHFVLHARRARSTATPIAG